MHAPGSATFLTAAATAVVGAMATDGWRQAQTAIAGLWWRVGATAAAAVGADLAQVRSRVLTARAHGDEAAEQALVADWWHRLGHLVHSRPDLGPELRQVLAQKVLPLLPDSDEEAQDLAAPGHDAPFDLWSEDGRYQLQIMILCAAIGLLVAALGILAGCGPQEDSDTGAPGPGAVGYSPGRSPEGPVGGIAPGLWTETGR